MAAPGFVDAPPALRRVHLDFHTPDFVENVGGRFNAERFVEILAVGEVQQAAFFAKCHYGNAYYPMRIGRPHPTLKRDMLGEFVAAAAKRGIRTFAYYSLQFDRWFGRQHPDCVQQPEPFFEPRYCGPWTSVCVNGPYGEYAREQIAEIVRDYELAGIWLDIVGYYPVCVCQRCRQSYQQRTGKPLPFDDAEPQAGIGSDYFLWQRRMLDEYTSQLAEMIDRLRPGCQLLCNTATGIREKVIGLTNQRDGQWCEEAVGNSPATLTTLSLYGSLFESAARSRSFEILTRRFHMGWGDWTLRPLEELKFDAASIFAHGGTVSIGDQLYGDGSFEPLVYERIGQAFHWLKQRQDFCGRTYPAAEVAVFAESTGHCADPGSIFYDSTACRNAEGLYKMLIDAHCPVAAIGELGVLASGRYKVLLIDDNLPDTESTVSALLAFVESGGRLLSVGVGPRRFWPVLGVTAVEPLPQPVCYIQMIEARSAELAMPVLARIQGHRVQLRKGAEVIARWVYPLCERTKETFYSHQHAPPGPPTDEPAVWRVGVGAGSVIGIAAPLATDYWRRCYSPLRMIVLDLLQRLLVNGRQVYVEAVPPATEVTLRRNDQAMFVHLVVPAISRPAAGTAEARFYMDDATEICGATVSLRLPLGQVCSSAEQLGQPLEVVADHRPGYVRVKLRPFRIHTVVRFDLGRSMQ